MSGFPMGIPPGSHGTQRAAKSALAIALFVAVSAGAGWVVSSLIDKPFFYIVICSSTLALLTGGCFVHAHRAQRDALGPLGLVSVFYFAAFAAGAIYFSSSRPLLATEQIPPVFEQNDLTAALILATLAFAAVATAYRLNPFRIVRTALPPLPRIPAASRRGRLLLVLFAIGWLARALTLINGSYFHVTEAGAPVATKGSWLIQALAHLPTVGVAFVGAQAYFLRRAGHRRIWSEALFWALMALEFAFYLPSGSRGSVIGLALMIVVVRYYGLGRRPSWIALAITAALTMLVVFPLELTYRNTTGGYQSNPQAALKSASTGLFSQRPSDAWRTGFDATFSRFSDVTAVAALLHTGPGAIDIKPGETLLWSAETFVPRAFYPAKADPGRFGNEFGRAYGLVANNDRRTSIAFPEYAEFYLNFGVLGMVLGMAVIGAFLRLVGDYFIGRKDDPAALAVYATAAWELVNGQESIVAVGLFGVVKLMLVLGLLLALVNKIQQVRLRPDYAPTLSNTRS